jgi:hypothetical protein
MRLYTDVNIDVRLVIFNGEKLIFCSRDAKSFRDEWKNKGVRQVISVITGEVWDLDDPQKVLLLNLPPVSVTITQGMNTFSTASVTFANIGGRFWKRKVGEKVDWSTWKNRSIFSDFEGDYEEAREILLKELRKCEGSDYYKNLLHYFKNPITETIDNFTRPFLVVDFGNLIFIDAKDRDGKWRALFTGYIETVSETYESAKDRRLTLSCSGLARYFDRVPAFPELGSGLFFSLILPDNLTEEEKSFYQGYFASYREYSDVFKDKFTQYENLKDLMKFILEIFRFRLGQLKEDEAEEVISKLKVAGMVSLSEPQKRELEDRIQKILEGFKQAWKDKGVHKFPFYNDVFIYTGFNNLRNKFYLPYGLKIGGEIKLLNKLAIADVYIPAEFDLFFEKGSGEGLGYYSTIFGEKLTNQLKDKDVAVLNFLKKLIGLSILQSPFHPTEKKLIEVIRAFLKAFNLFFFEDGFGNIVMDFIRYNEIPTSPYAFYEELRENGDKYIFREEKDILSSSFTKDGSKLMTAFYFHSMLNIPGVPQLSQFITELMNSGHAFASPEFVLRFGYNVETIQDVFLSWKINLFQYKELVKTLNEYAMALLEQRNALRCFRMRITTRHRPDLQVGRVIYLPSQEKLWFIEKVSHTITLGSDFTTTLELSAGHDINYKLREPRVVLIKKLSDFHNELYYPDGQTETSFSPECGLVLVNGTDFPAEIKESVLYAPAKFVEDKTLYKVSTQFNPFLHDFYKERSSQWIVIDIRLLYFLDWFHTAFTNFFNKDPVYDYYNREKLLNEPDIVVLPYISSIWRNPVSGKESRHYKGRAIDISGIVFVIFSKEGFKKLFEGLKNLVKLGSLPCKKYEVVREDKNFVYASSVESNLEEVLKYVNDFTMNDIYNFIKAKEGYFLVASKEEKETFKKQLKLLSLKDLFHKYFDKMNFRKDVRMDELWIMSEWERKLYTPLLVSTIPDVKEIIKQNEYIKAKEGIPNKDLPKYVKAFDEGVYILKFSFDASEGVSIERLALANAFTSIFLVPELISPEYNISRKIGRFVDASGGILELLAECVRKKVIGDEFYQMFENYYKAEVRTTQIAGKEEDIKKNYLIWIAGNGKNYEQILDDFDDIKEEISNSGDVYHLYHVHISVGKPDCKEIQFILKGLK